MVMINTYRFNLEKLKSKIAGGHLELLDGMLESPDCKIALRYTKTLPQNNMPGYYLSFKSILIDNNFNQDAFGEQNIIN